VDQQRHLDLRRGHRDPNLKKIAEDMNHAYMPTGPIGKPTELHLMFPMLR